MKPPEQVGKEKMQQEDSSCSTGPALPPLPREREANQPAITTFFGKSPKKPPEEKEEPKKEEKEASKGKSIVKGKMVPRKSTRGAPTSIILEQESPAEGKDPKSAETQQQPPAATKKTPTTKAAQTSKQDKKKGSTSKSADPLKKQVEKGQTVRPNRKRWSDVKHLQPPPANTIQNKTKEVAR